MEGRLKIDGKKEADLPKWKHRLWRPSQFRINIGINRKNDQDEVKKG